MIIKKCEYCGKEKEYKYPSLAKRFCCHLCSNKWKWENVRKKSEKEIFVCENCKKEFYIKKAEAKVRKKFCKIRFCCLDCYRSFVKKKPKICPNCKKSFVPKDSRRKCCCKECSTQYILKTKKLQKKGFYITQKGYKYVNIFGKYVLEHRLVYEQNSGKKLKPENIIHHKDGNKLNNNFNNLMLVDASEHSKIHKYWKFRK